MNQNSECLIEENAYENVICKMGTIFSQPQCVKCFGDIISSLYIPVIHLLIFLGCLTSFIAPVPMK